MARYYRRDSRGRFSSTGTTGRSKPKALPGGTLAARTSLRKSRQKLAGKDAADLSLSGTLSRRSQAAAVTRGKNRLREAVKSSRVKIAAGPGGVIRRSGTQRKINAKPSNTIAKPRGMKPGTMKPKPQAPRAANTDRAQSSTPKRKVDIQIKRAKPGGEYGPDGHFYSGGSWMPLGKFQGGGKQMQALGKEAGAPVKQAGKNGGDGTTRVVRQARKERPPLEPTGQAALPKINISKRGEENMSNFFARGYYTSYEKGRDGFIKLKDRGWKATAAFASRLTPKETGAAIVKLRRMAKDKKEFDAELNWDRQLSTRPGAYGYEEARRGGYLPRGLTKNQWARTSQLEHAIGMIASQRKQRPDNRRTGSEEYVWVMNNLLGRRAQRSPARQSDQSATSSRRGVRGPAMRGVLRPISTRRLVAAGGSRWQKGPHDRIYFNGARSGKIFYDRNTRRMVTQGGDPRKLASEAQQIARAGRRPVPQRWKRGQVPK